MSATLEFTPVGGKIEDDLNEYYITSFKDGFLRCNGTVVLSQYKRVAETILNFEVRDDDIWVCTFPKSGTTWVQEMVWCIAKDLDFEGAKVDISKRFIFIDLQVFRTEDECALIPPELQEFWYRDCVADLKNMTSPRFIKTHLPYDLLPLQLQLRTTKAKVVYLARNVKDTCVSLFYHTQLWERCTLFYHTQLWERCTGSLDQFASIFINDAIPYSPYWKHIFLSWKRMSDPNMLFLKYEDMKQDLGAVLKRTAEFLGKDLTDKQVEVLCDHLSFENMKNNPALNYEGALEALRKYNLARMDGTFLRCGQVGDWKTKLSPYWIQRFDQWIKDHLQNTEYSV